MASISYLGLNETGKKITRFLNSVLSHIEKIHKFMLQSNVFLFSFLFYFFSQWKATWEIHCCCSSSHSTWCLCTCWGMCTHHRDILFVCTQYRLCRRLLEQTERSSLHSGARGKPLIKQRDRNWPSWWYNLYTRNATNAHSNVNSTRTHTQMCFFICTYPKLHWCRNGQVCAPRAHGQHIYWGESVCGWETISMWAR